MTKAKEYKITVVKNSFIESVQVTTSYHAAEFCRKFYHEDLEIYESFFIALLNRRNKITAWAKISQGGVCGTICDPKIVGKYIADTLSPGIILCHNHPSGNRQPSQTDIELTKKIKAMAALLDCQVIDHIILTEDSYFSFLDEGQL